MGFFNTKHMFKKIHADIAYWRVMQKQAATLTIEELLQEKKELREENTELLDNKFDFSARVRRLELENAYLRMDYDKIYEVAQRNIAEKASLFEQLSRLRVENEALRAENKDLRANP